MKCMKCGAGDTKVLDTRSSKDGDAVKRRRACPECQARFTTYEKIEEATVFIVKRDGRREPFDIDKLTKSIRIACHKRNISIQTMTMVAGSIKKQLLELNDTEIHVNHVGACVMTALKTLDEVAYVRFASVYKQFKDPSEFVSELKNLH